MHKLSLRSLEETQAFARQIAGLALPGDIITLQGELGAGKSEFARAFIKSLAGEDTVVPSPTFTILEQYETPKGIISHFDLYRIESAEELVELGFEEALSNRIALIEWPERLGEYPLPNLLQLFLSADAETEERIVILKPDDGWVSRLVRVLNGKEI